MKRNFAISEQVFAIHLNKVYQEPTRKWNSYSPPFQDEHFSFTPNTIGAINPIIDNATINF